MEGLALNTQNTATIKRTLEGEIQKITGVVFRSIPADGLMRKFMVGRDEWSAISFGDCGAFGCFHKEEFYSWPGHGFRSEPIFFPGQPERLSKRQMNAEREIIAIGNAMQDAGQLMSGADTDRYILALKRSIEAGQAAAQAAKNPDGLAEQPEYLADQ